MLPGNNNRITAAIGEDTKQEIKEKGFLFFYAYFAYFRLFCMGKYRRKTGRIHAMQAGGKRQKPAQRSPSVTKSKILPQYQISLIAHFVLRESCWGCHPKPAFCGLRRLKKSTHELKDKFR